MKGLILKDCYTLYKQSKMFLIMIIIFSIVPIYGSGTCVFSIMLSAMLALTTLAYDERSKWNTLAEMMPYSSAQIIVSKYVLAYMCILAAAVMSSVFTAIRTAFAGGLNGIEFLLPIGAAIGIAALMTGIIFFFMFIFGVEKGRLAYIVAIALVMIIAVGAGDKLLDLLNTLMFSKAVLAILLVCAVVAVNLVSIFAAVKFYRKNR